MAKLSRQELNTTVSSESLVLGWVSQKRIRSGQLKTKRPCFSKSFVRNIVRDTLLPDKIRIQFPPLAQVLPPGV